MKINNKILNIFFWLIYFSIIIYVEKDFYPSIHETLVTNSGKFLMMIVCYFVLIKIILPKFRKKEFISLSIFFVLFMYFISVFNIGWRVWVLQNIYPNTYINEMYTFSPRYINNIGWILGIYITYYFKPSFLITFYKYVVYEKRIQTIKNEKNKLELTLLKSQLSPHLLFNTMNNIYGLALEDGKSAATLILKLSTLLQYLVYRAEKRSVPLEEEIKQIQNYIEIETLRFDEGYIDINLEIDFPENTFRIAPLIILSYIENAFKHGLKTHINKNFIYVKVFNRSNNIYITIKNSKSSLKTEKENSNFSIGTINLQKQLNIIYPGKHNLKINESENYYELKLILSNV